VLAALLATNTALAASSDSKERAMAKEIELYLNTLLDYTTTVCATRGALAGKGRAVSCATKQAMLDDEKRRKAFVLTALGAVGKVTRDTPSFQCEDVLLADTATAERGIAYRLPCSKVKDLQRGMYDGTVSVEEAWSQAASALKEVTLTSTTQSRKQSAPPAPSMDKETRFQLAVAGAKSLKEAMRNPDSFKLVKVITLDDGTSCYEYRAQNGFGGMDVGRAVVTPKGRISISDSDGFASTWNKSCANKSGEDNTWTVGYAAGLHGIFGD